MEKTVAFDPSSAKLYDVSSQIEKLSRYQRWKDLIIKVAIIQETAERKMKMIIVPTPLEGGRNYILK